MQQKELKLFHPAFNKVQSLARSAGNHFADMLSRILIALNGHFSFKNVIKR